jgi:hypothetical protein
VFLRLYGAVIRLSAILAVGLSGASLGGCASSQPPRLSSDIGTYWCVMHPHIRGNASSVCPICGMALVPATTDYRPYTLDLEVEPQALQPGQPGKLRFRVRDPRTGAPVTRLEMLHERVFHLFVISHDLEYFAHLHPVERPDAALEIEITLPRPGAYRLIADFLPQGGAPQLIERSIATAGYRGPLGAVAAPAVDVSRKTVNGTRVEMFGPAAVAGVEQLLTFELSDGTSGQPVNDLEPYLGATGHLLVVHSDLSVSFHSHPVAEITKQFGPTVVFQMVFPRAGVYRVWAQFQRHGTVGTTAFTMSVAERH